MALSLAEQRKRLVKATQFVSGGLVNDIDVEVLDAKFVYFDYDGQGPEVVASQLTLKDSDGEEHIQHWPVGGRTQDGDNLFIPSDDGKFIYRAKDKGSLNRGSNHFLMIETLKRCGLADESIVDEDISSLIGMKGHVLRYPAPKRTMPNQKTREDGREPEFLGWSEVYSFPWDAKGKKGGGKTAGKAQGASKGSKGEDSGASGVSSASEGDGDGPEAIAELQVRKALAGAPDGLDIQDLTIAVLTALTEQGMSKADRKPIMALITDSFVEGLDNVDLEDGIYSLG